MYSNYDHTDLPVLLLYNIDPSWPSQDTQDCHAEAHLLKDALHEVGHPVQEVCVQSAELEPILDGFTLMNT